MSHLPSMLVTTGELAFALKTCPTMSYIHLGNKGKCQAGFVARLSHKEHILIIRLAAGRRIPNQPSCKVPGLIPRPHPLRTRRNSLVNQATFLGLAHTFATVSPSNTENILHPTHSKKVWMLEL